MIDDWFGVCWIIIIMVCDPRRVHADIGKDNREIEITERRNCKCTCVVLIAQRMRKTTTNKALAQMAFAPKYRSNTRVNYAHSNPTKYRHLQSENPCEIFNRNVVVGDFLMEIVSQPFHWTNKLPWQISPVDLSIFSLAIRSFWRKITCTNCNRNIFFCQFYGFFFARSFKARQSKRMHFDSYSESLQETDIFFIGFEMSWHFFCARNIPFIIKVSMKFLSFFGSWTWNQLHFRFSVHIKSQIKPFYEAHIRHTKSKWINFPLWKVPKKGKENRRVPSHGTVWCVYFYFVVAHK